MPCAIMRGREPAGSQHARALSRTTTKLQPTVSILSLKFATSGGLDLEAQ